MSLQMSLAQQVLHRRCRRLLLRPPWLHDVHPTELQARASIRHHLRELQVAYESLQEQQAQASVASGT